MKRVGITVGIILVVLLGILVALPFLIDANQFRPRLEAELTNALGREVKVGNLKLAILSGSVAADGLSIADDPAFSRAPFVQAKSLKVGVELLPLVLSRKVNVTGLTIDQPEIVLLQTAAGDWNFSKLGAKSAPKAAEVATAGKAGLDLSVKLVKISDGRLSLGKTGGRGKPLLLENLNLELRDFSATSVMPFSLSGKVAGDGQIKIEGKAGPIDTGNVVLTPVQVSLKIAHLDLAASGVVENSVGIAGLVSLDSTAASNGKSLDVSGRVKAEKLKLVKGGSPAKGQVEFDFALAHDLKTGSGLLRRGSIHIGSAVAGLVGVYSTERESTFLKANLSGLNMPVPELAAMLPALNIALPAGSSLDGGTAVVKLAVEGPTNRLIANGSLGISNTRLAGFDLGLKMSVIETLAGIKGGPNTEIQTLSTNLRASQEGGATLQDIKLVVPAIGELSGAGSISPANALDFKMSATVHTSGVMAALGHTAIPFMIQGTASNPMFKPDVKGLAVQELKSVKGDAVKTGLDLLNGFLDKKKK